MENYFKEETNELYLKDLLLESPQNKFVYLWDYISISNDYARLYYLPHETLGTGFDYFAVLNVNRIENWPLEDTEIEILFNGVAYFEGVEHFFLGNTLTNNYNYLSSPDLDIIIEVLNNLKSLDIKYCSDSRYL